MKESPLYRAKHRQKTNRRRTRKLNAQPNWLDDVQLAEIEEIYLEAVEKTLESGEPHEVDHIILLQGDNFCGLHVPWNLRVLTRSENRSKGNKPD